jgi:hypothetical protein
VIHKRTLALGVLAASVALVAVVLVLGSAAAADLSAGDHPSGATAQHPPSPCRAPPGNGTRNATGNETGTGLPPPPPPPPPRNGTGNATGSGTGGPPPPPPPPPTYGNSTANATGNSIGRCPGPGPGSGCGNSTTDGSVVAVLRS